MATQLTLYNGALRIIKNRRLSALTDDTEARYLLDDEYTKVKAYMLEQGLWNFALRASLLEPDTDNTPEFGWTYAFAKPNDYVRLNAISGNAYFEPTLEGYEDEGAYFLASVNPLYISYVSNGATYGGDLSKWTSSYELAVEYELAYRIAPHLTSMGTSGMEMLYKEKEQALKNAKNKDALNQPAKRPPPGRLVRSRAGGSRLSGRPWWR